MMMPQIPTANSVEEAPISVPDNWNLGDSNLPATVPLGSDTPFTPDEKDPTKPPVTPEVQDGEGEEPAPFALGDTAIDALHAGYAAQVAAAGEEGEGSGKLLADQAEALILKVCEEFPETTTLGIEQLRDFVTRIYRDFADAEGHIMLDDLLYYMDPVHALRALADEEWEMLELYCDPGIALGPPVGARNWVWAVMNVEEASKYLTENDWLRKLAVTVQTISQLAISTSIVNMMVESEPSVHLEVEEQGTSAPTYLVEALTIAIFTLEFGLRVYSTPAQGVFWKNTYTWIDLLSILPFYLFLLGVVGDKAKGLAVLRIVRLARLLRILKVGRHSVGIHLMVLSVRKALLPLLWLWFVLVLAMVLFSALMYQAETMWADLDEEKEKWVRPADSPYDDAGLVIDIQSIHGALWWAVVTITTTGYGDNVPRTGLGKLVGAMTMMCGVILLAFPTTILTQQFTRVFEEYEERREQQEKRQRIRRKLLTEHFRKPSPEPISKQNTQTTMLEKSEIEKDSGGAGPPREVTSPAPESCPGAFSPAARSYPDELGSRGVTTGTEDIMSSTDPEEFAREEGSSNVVEFGVQQFMRGRRKSTTGVTGIGRALRERKDSQLGHLVTRQQEHPHRETHGRSSIGSSCVGPPSPVSRQGSGRSLVSLFRQHSQTANGPPQPGAVRPPIEDRSISGLRSRVPPKPQPLRQSASQSSQSRNLDQSRSLMSVTGGQSMVSMAGDEVLREQLREIRQIQKDAVQEQARELAAIRAGVLEAVEVLKRIEQAAKARKSPQQDPTPASLVSPEPVYPDLRQVTDDPLRSSGRGAQRVVLSPSNLLPEMGHLRSIEGSDGQ
eukprot:Hpha_TRINITY_DN13223_c0_g1::TRINITY_DN13223_c0_g1_i1::g.154586::m.154586/K04877/KCNA4; potassium voltage-gated channel Shaker-related subfamily A member 4